MASAVLLLLVLLTTTAGGRLICWQALLRCQGDPECAYAYGLYTEACASILPPGDPTAAYARGRRCPSHCISALIQLNQTRHGPALEDCDCARDESCRSTKRAIEPCLPRSAGTGGGSSASATATGGVLGCTEARRHCERDHRCSAALALYLAHCGKLFNGNRCTHECRQVIQDMLLMPKALLLSDCVCDGLERPICEVVKENMDLLCFPKDAGSSGGSSPDQALDDYYYDEEEDEPEQARTQHPPHRAPAVRDSDPSGGSPTPLPGLLSSLTVLLPWTLALSILL